MMILQNDSVRLEPLSFNHLEALTLIGDDKEIWTHLSMEATTKEAMHRFIDIALNAEREGTQIPYVIIDQQQNQIVGSTRFMDIDREHRRAEIGTTWLHPSVWRTKINTNCKFLLLEYGFEVLGFQRIQLKTGHENKRSQRAIERLGATKEGILRNHMMTRHATIRHTVMYSFISDEWPEIKRALQQLCE